VVWTLLAELAKSGSPWLVSGLLFLLFNAARAWRYFHDRMMVREFREIKGDKVSMTRRRFGGPELRREAVERDSEL
jgi:hypothetical protein